MNEEPREPKISHLYGGEIVVSFNPDAKRNRYTVTDCGAKIKPAPPSVTTICGLADFGKSTALSAWSVNMCLEVLRERIKADQIHGAQFLEEAFADAKANYRNVKKKAADVGTLAHFALERWFANDPHFAPPLAGTPVRACFDGAVNWWNSHAIKNVSTETVVYSRKHEFIGTFDNLSEIGGVLSLLDYKSSKHVYATFVAQLAAYVLAYEEEHPVTRIEQAVVLQLAEDGAKPYIYNRRQLEDAQRAFLALLDLYRWEKALGKMKPEEIDWIDAL